MPSAERWDEIMRKMETEGTRAGEAVQEESGERAPINASGWRAQGLDEPPDGWAAECFWLLQKSLTYFSHGRIPEAIGFLEEARSSARHLPAADAAQKECGALDQLGGIYLSVGQIDEALACYSDAAALAAEHLANSQAHGRVLGQLALVLSQLQQADRALEAYLQAIAIMQVQEPSITIVDADGNEIEDREIPNMLGHLFTGIGNVYCQQGAHDKAAESHLHALELYCSSERKSRGIAMANLGRVYRLLGQHDMAIENLQLAVREAREYDRLMDGLLQALPPCLCALGEYYLHVGDFAAALPPLKECADIHSVQWSSISTDQERITYGETQAKAYALLQAVHAALDQPEAALLVAELNHSRALEILLAQQRLVSGSNMPAADYGHAVPQLSIEQLKALAQRQNVTVVIFSEAPPALLLVWLIRPGDKPLCSHQIDLAASETTLAQLIEHTRRTIGARARHIVPRDMALMDDSEPQGAVPPAGPPADGETIDVLLRRCHELLITPLNLSDNEPLLLIPDHDLYALPFAALCDVDGRHLIERHSVRVAPSVGTVIELERRAATRPMSTTPSALVVGDPSFGRGWASTLPGARAEAQQVKLLLEAMVCKNAVDLKVGQEAQKAAVVQAMQGRDVVHLATHGEPDAVLLGGATRTEGRLSMAEVQRLELNAQLVVLSECDSFRGKLTSDGVIGVARAFVGAGALTLVASLWKVDDDATLALMTHFYKALLSSGCVGDVAAALRAAMVSMISEGRWSVMQWASFVVYGLASPSARP